MSPPDSPEGACVRAKRQGHPVDALALRRAWRMLQAPWQWRANDGGPWAGRLYGAVVALLLGAPALAALVWMPPRAAVATLGLCALLGLALVWVLQFSALLRLDHPHAAHAVPGHTPALQAAALGLWLALVALSAGVSALAGALLAGDGLRPGLLAALGTGTVLTLLALVLRWWWLWIPLCLGPSLMGLAGWRRLVLGGWHWAQQHWQAQPLLGTLAVLLVLALLLPGLFGQGDARHARAYASRERWRKITAASAAGQKPALAAYGRWGEWLGLPWQALADGWLAHVCRHAHTGQASVMARADIVLYDAQHWLRHLSTGLVVQGVVVFCLWLVVKLSRQDLSVLLDGGRVGIGIGLASMALSAVTSLPGALWRTRREQALLVLLPGMPQGVALNRALAWSQMRHCLWVWLVVLPGLAAMVWAGQGLAAIAFGLMALPLSAWLWRDVARLGAPRAAHTFGLMLVCMLGGGLSLALLSQHPQALLPWALGLLLLSAGLLRWRWRALRHLPPALPAGRLA